MKMNKIIGISIISAMFLGVVGCQTNHSTTTDQQQQGTGSNQSDGNNNTSSSTGSNQQNNGQSNNNSGQSNNSGQNSGSGQNGSSNQNGGSNSGNNGQSNTPPTTTQEALKDVTAALNTRVPLMLPTSVPVTQGKYLTATTTSETWYYKVQFYEANDPTEINSQAASKGVPIATVEGTEYKNAASAKENIIGYVQINPTQNPTIDLGHGIKGVADAGMGHSYIMWNEGHWSIKIDSPNDPQYKSTIYPDSRKLAEDIVSYLNAYFLPAPQDIGVITVNNWNKNAGTTIQWQYHEMIYQVTSNDPFVALKVAVAMAFNSK
jgi:hypothetical protein